jgi:hypothetical protein
MTETEIDRQSIIPYIFIQKMRMNVDFISSLLCNKIINGNADCTNDQKKIMKNIFDDLLIYNKIRVNFINESDMNAFILNLAFVFSIIYPEMFDECIASMDIIALKDFTLENIRDLKAIKSDEFTPGNELYNKVQNINESDYKKIVFSVDEASLLSVIMSQHASLDAVIIEDYELYKKFIDIKMKMQRSYDEKMKGFFEKIRQDVFSEPEDKHVNVDEQKLSEIIYDEYYSIWLFRWFMTEIFADIQKNNQGKKESLFNALQDRGLNKTEIFYIITQTLAHPEFLHYTDQKPTSPNPNLSCLSIITARPGLNSFLFECSICFYEQRTELGDLSVALSPRSATLLTTRHKKPSVSNLLMQPDSFAKPVPQAGSSLRSS